MRRVLYAVGLLAVMSVVFGCSSANPFSIQKAYADTVAAKTADVTMAIDLQGGGSPSGSSVHIRGTGTVDLAHNAIEMNLNVPFLGTVRSIDVGGITYVHLPSNFPGSRLPAGKTWESTPDCGPTTSSSSSSSEDPMQMLKQLSAASTGGVVTVGTEDVLGKSMTHYRATLDPKKLSALFSSGNCQATQHSSGGPGLSPTGKPSVDVWIDSQDRFGRLAANVPFTKFNQKTVMDFVSYGVPVEITPPPPSQVVAASAVGG